MPSTLPVFQQAGFATAQFNYPILLNDLNSNDRSFLKTLIRKYGTENYGLWQLLMGQTATYENTDNKQYYHYEKRELHASLAIANTVANTGAGNTITFLVASDGYYMDGSTPARVGEEGIIDSSGVAVQISAVPVTTANAWQVTLKPLNTGDTIASVGGVSLLAGDAILFRGKMDVGEASSSGTGIAPVYDKIYNTTTEHRDDFTATDFVMMEKQEVMLVDGQQYYMPLAMDDMNKRFMNQMFWKIMEANGASNLAANGTFGTIGVQPRVAASGSTVQYTAGNPSIADFQTMGRALNFFGSPGEYHLLNDFYAKQGISNLLETFYKGTFNHASYDSVGGSKESGGAYGFDTFRADNITYHETVNPMYNTEMIYKRVPQASTGSFYRNYSIAIPQRTNQDPKMRDGDGNALSYPSFQIVFQKSPVDGNRIYSWEYGGAAAQNKTGTLNKTISMQSYYGVRVIAAVQYALFLGK